MAWCCIQGARSASEGLHLPSLALRAPEDLLQELLRYLGNRPIGDIAIKHFRPFRLDLDLAFRQRHFLAIDHAPRVGQYHHDLVVDDVHAGAADGQKFDGVPLAGWFFVVRALDDARAAAVLAGDSEFVAALLVDDGTLAVLAI